MSVVITPKGTYGRGLPSMPGWLAKSVNTISTGIFHRFGRWMRVQGRPLLLLTTLGAKTGQARQTVLGYFPAGEHAWLIVGSAGGAARHPAWFFNLAKNPDNVWIEIEGRRIHVRPESLTGTERAAAWQQVVTLAPAYANYAHNTDREIPLIRLTPIE